MWMSNLGLGTSITAPSLKWESKFLPYLEEILYNSFLGSRWGVGKSLG